jgi:hypothetical protein
MKSLAWIFVVGFSVTAVGASSGCTVSASSGGGDDAGLLDEPESSTSADTGTQPDTSTSPDAGTMPDVSATPDTASTQETGATADGSDAGSCSIVGTSFGSMACDQCLADRCCNESTACFTGAENDCQNKVLCWRDCVVGNPDAGVPPGTPTSCKSDCEGPDAMASAFDTWVTCYPNCSSMCQ